MKNYIRLYLLASLILTSLFTSLKAQQFSVLICKSGTNILNAFGHIALRYYDPYKGLDNVYDFGVHDFSSHQYITKFFLEKLDYEVTKEPTAYFLDYYLNKNIQVKEQVLNLSNTQIKNLIGYLELSLIQGLNVFKYDFLYQNCSTKILETLEKGCGGIKFNFYKESKRQTYRQLIHAKSKDLLPWEALTMDLLIGTLTDKKITDREYCFLPKYLSKSLRLCYNEDLNLPLVKNEQILFKQDFEVYNRPLYSKPEFYGLILLILALLHNHLNRRMTQILMGLFYIAIGLIGCLASFEMLFSSLAVTKANFNIGWMNPLSLLYGILLIKNKDNNYLRFFILLGIILSFAAGFLNIQGFQITTFMLMTAALLGCVKISIKDAIFLPLKRKQFVLETDIA
jgi:hypothetical protein